MIEVRKTVQSVKVVKLDEKNSHVYAELEIGSEDLEPQYQFVLEKLSKQARIKGFRQGRAPIGLVEQKYGERADAILLEDILDNAMTEFNEQHDYTVIENPKITLNEYKRREFLSFSADYDIFPKFDLPVYQKIVVKENIGKVEESDVQNYLEKIREKYAELKTREGKAQKGDELTLMVTLSDPNEDNKILEENVIKKTILGENENLPELDKNLQNVEVDANLEFDIKYPKDFDYEELRGKTMHFQVVVKEINEVVFPPIDDELAKDEGYDDLAQMKQRLRENLEELLKIRFKEDVKEEGMKKIVEQAKLDIPISKLQDKLQDNIQAEAKKRNITVQSLDELQEAVGGKEGKKLAEDIQAKAEFEAKAGFVLLEISKKENIVVTDEDIEEEVSIIADKHPGVDIGFIRKRLQEDEKTMKKIENDVFMRKLFDFIYDKVEKKKGKIIKFSDIVKKSE